MSSADWLDAVVASWRWYLLVVILLLADQWTKGLAVNHLDYARPLKVLPFLDFTLLHNTGAAFSFLSDAGGWQRWGLSLLSSAVSIMLMVWIPLQKNLLAKLALALVLAGALGNLYDRITLGYVVDFISVHYQTDWYFPAFNLADSCISVGAFLLIMQWAFEGGAK